MSVLELENEVKNLRETIYLFKFLFPDNSFRKPEKQVQEFNEKNKTTSLRLLNSLFKSSKNNYESLFINLTKEKSVFKNNSSLDEITKEMMMDKDKEFSKESKSASLITFPQESMKDEIDSIKQKKPKIPNLALTLNNQNEIGFNGTNTIFNNKQNAPKMKIPHLKLTMTGPCGESNEENTNNEECEEDSGVDKVEKEVIVMKEEQINVEFPKKSYRKDKESSFDERNSENSMKRQIKNLELSIFEVFF